MQRGRGHRRADVDGDVARGARALRAARMPSCCAWAKPPTMSGEAASRAHLGLPGAAARSSPRPCSSVPRALGKPVVVLLFSGRPLVVPWLVEQGRCRARRWFLGSEAGNAIADVVTGRVSPSGRTPVTWPRAVGQIPIFFGERPSGRPANPTDHFTSKYLDAPNEPLFPFGHGLTYGRFALSNLRVTPRECARATAIEVRVDVTNEGTRAAEETVFLFTHDKARERRAAAARAEGLWQDRAWSRVKRAP